MKKYFKKVSPAKNGRRRKGSMNTSFAAPTPQNPSTNGTEAGPVTVQLLDILYPAAAVVARRYRPRAGGVEREGASLAHSVVNKLRAAVHADPSKLNQAFVYRALINKALDDLRASKRDRSTRLDEVNWERVIASLAAPGEAADFYGEVWARLRRHFGNTDQFQLLDLAVSKSYTVEQLAAVHGVSYEGMKKRLQRAREVLKPHVLRIGQALVEQRASLGESPQKTQMQAAVKRLRPARAARKPSRRRSAAKNC